VVERLRWGVLSTANIGLRKVIPAIQASNNGEVVAIASRDLPRAEDTAAELGIPSAYGSYEALLAATDVDAIYLPLPNDLHAPWTMASVEAGKHVLCEKPLAMSADEATRMAAAADAAGVKLAEAFMYRHHPAWVETLRLLRAGAVGELQAVQSWFSYFNDDPANIRNQREHGGGAVMDIGCYSIHLSRLLFAAEPTDIRAAVRLHSELGVDTLSSAVLTFPSGGQATFTCSMRMAPDQRVVVHGSEGRIEIEKPFTPPPDETTRILVTAGRGGARPTETEVVSFDPANAFTIQAERFAQAVLDGTELDTPIDDAIANMRVIESVLGAA
jgi:predicted dehydrogenase